MNGKVFIKARVDVAGRMTASAERLGGIGMTATCTFLKREPEHRGTYTIPRLFSLLGKFLGMGNGIIGEHKKIEL